MSGLTAALRAVLAVGALSLGALAGAAADLGGTDLGGTDLGGLRLAAAMQADPECNGSERSCVGCSDLVQCVRIGSVWKRVSTVSCTSATPYCRDGQCVGAMPPALSCGQPAVVDYVCPKADGYFPDMASCTRYFLCVNNTAFALDCHRFPGTMYDPRTSLCVPMPAGSCYTLTCSEDSIGQYQIYAPAPWIYAVCVSTNAAEALVGVCDQGFAVDASQPELCVVACQAAGRFADPRTTDATAFYECVYLGDGRLSKPMPAQCPQGSSFDGERQQCVSSRPG